MDLLHLNLDGFRQFFSSVTIGDLSFRTLEEGRLFYAVKGSSHPYIFNMWVSSVDHHLKIQVVGLWHFFSILICETLFLSNAILLNTWVWSLCFVFILLSIYFPFSFFLLCLFVPTTILTTNKQQQKICHFNPSLNPTLKTNIQTNQIKYQTPKPTWKWFIQSNGNPLLDSTPTLQSEPSAPPQDVKCSSQSSTNILVSWRPPPMELQNGIITKYTIQYAATEGEDLATRQISDIPPETTEYVLENLEKWTEYRVAVTAHTDVGPGPESLPQLIRTEEDGMFCLPACQPAPMPFPNTASST